MKDAGLPPLVVVSNRGPVSFRRSTKGVLTPTKGGGGLVASLAPAVARLDALWVATAVSEEDREAASNGPVDAHGFRLCQLAIKPSVYRQYYDVIANGTLWFLHHNLFDLARRPHIDSHWWEAWHTYCEVNRLFAEAVAEAAPPGAVVLIHDYHLSLLGKHLKEKRPDIKTVHFHHTPFADPNSINVLPRPVVHALLEGLASNDACGFHSQRWEESFGHACLKELGYAPKTFVSAATPDGEQLAEVARSQMALDTLKTLDELAGDRKLIVRVDRVELSKNLLRGFLAYDDMLRRFPRWRGRVTFAAFVYPSREGLAEYLAYRSEVEGLVNRINAEWSTDDWSPIVLHLGDHFPKSVAALMRYDVLLVNPVRDGLNLVAKEGAVLNKRNGAIVLSREAGSWEELADAAIGVNPFDILGTSDALVHALEMSEDERRGRSEQLRRITEARNAHDWISDQLRAVGIDHNSESANG